MYLLPDMIDLGFSESSNETWTSPDHRQVAQAILLGNRNINTRQDLIENVGIINKIPQDKIREVAVDDLIKLGVTITFN